MLLGNFTGFYWETSEGCIWRVWYNHLNPSETRKEFFRRINEEMQL